MDSQFIRESLKINVTQGIIPGPIPGSEIAGGGLPDTGLLGSLGDFINTLGPLDCSFVIICFVSLIVTTILFFNCRKFSKPSLILKISFAFLFITLLAGLIIPSFAHSSYAADAEIPHTTIFNITTGSAPIASAINTEGITLAEEAPYGYKITAYVDGDGTLTNGTSIINPTTTPVADADSLAINTYAIKDITNNQYIAISTDFANPTIIFTTTDPATAGTPITLTYAARLDSTLTEGTYAGRIHYKIVPLINSYTVHYDASGGTGVPADQTAIDATEHTFILTDLTPAQIPTRDGYTFGGWTTVAENQAGAYSPGSELYLTKDNPSVTLYAIWIPNSEMGFGSLTGDNAKMQNMTFSVCDAITTPGTTGRLQDTRDYKVYYVTKMKDDHCWMSQNLSLEISKDKTYTSEDTNVSTSWKPGDSSSIHKSTIPHGYLVNDATWKDSDNFPYSYNPGDNYFVTNDKYIGDDPETTSGDAHYSAGNYYNWSAAVAENDTSSHATQFEIMPNSICPKGWRLPRVTSASSTEWGSLLYSQGIIPSATSESYATDDGFRNIRKDPLWLVRSGFIGYRAQIFYSGHTTSYLTSTVKSIGYVYSLYFWRDVELFPLLSEYRQVADPIRCLAE